MNYSMEGEASCSTTALRRPTLADQMSAVDSSNIRQLLVQGGQSRDSFTGLSLNALLAFDKLPPSQSPSQSPSTQGLTLLDIIRSEEPKQADGYNDLIGNKDRYTWKTFRDKLRLKRAVGVTDQMPVERPQTVQPVLDSSTRMSDNEGRSDSVRSDSVRLSTVLAEERQLSNREVEVVQEMVEDGGEQPARMSLMELLEETDRQMMSATTGFGEGGEDGDLCLGGRIEHTCCVCMVRHKGAAFIPCGHTFCRMCSRELWVQRGNCPLCNNQIVEVLDIF